MEVPIAEGEYKKNTAMKLALITKKGKEDPKLKFTSLAHLLNVEYLKECYGELKKKKASGIDGKTVESYTDIQIQEELEKVVDKMKRRAYRPQPVRRVLIDKSDGRKRHLGIPTVIDKTVQLGMAKIMEPIFEPLFKDFSFGFRKGRKAHDCLKELNHIIMQKKVNWVIDTDIKGFFDNVDHKWMLRCLDQKIVDPRFKELVMKFLKAGIMEKGSVKSTVRGTPQGGIISPLLANIYLHYALDLWFVDLKQKVKGNAYLIRYADDFVIATQHEHEAMWLLDQLKARLMKFGLELSEEKTSIIEFGRYAEKNRQNRGKGRPKTFNFLGFTLYCSRTRDGRFMVKMKTSRKKFNSSIKAMNIWLKSIRNLIGIVEIWKLLALKLQGHYNYYGLSGNFESIKQFYRKTMYLTFKWLNRRSQKKSFSWEKFFEYISKHSLPKPRLTYEIYNTW